MAADPLIRYLDVPPSADARTLLGLGPGPLDPGRIETALRERLARVYNHPESDREDAEAVRRKLREAARELLAAHRPGGPRTPPPRGAAGPIPVPSPKPSPVPRPPPAAALTDFDRHVLAVLVGCGGWNTTSRAKLVSLAAAHGVSVQGLIRVVTGLGEFARHGGRRLDVAEITSGGARVMATPPQPIVDEAPGWVERLAPELREPDAGSTAKLAVLFALLTILAGFVAVRFLFFPSDFGHQKVVESYNAPLEDAGEPLPLPRVDEAPRGEGGSLVRPLALDAFPTFVGRTLPAEAGRAADDCPRLPARIDELARRIAIAREPSDAVYRGFAEDCRIAGLGWVLIDEKTRQQIEEAVLEALYAASDTPSVTDRLLGALIPPSGRLGEPVDVWRGAWQAGVLGRIAASTTLAPAVVERAQTQLDVGVRATWRRGTPDVESAARAWRDDRVRGFVEGLTLDARTYDFWESWIAAQRRLGRGERFQAACANAVQQILETSTDLSRPGPALNVLGRLVSALDFEASPVVRRTVRSWFEATDSITAHDLWVLTSLLAQEPVAPWFAADLVLPDDADWMFRRRVADRIGQRWPAPADIASDLARAGASAVDPELALRWRRVLEEEAARPVAAEREALLDQLARASLINEAAQALAAGAAAVAEDAMDLLEKPAGTEPPARAAARRGQPIGPDGAWAVAWQAAGRNADEKLRLLAALRAGAGTDLGPLDAAVFVAAVYRRTPQEVRIQAQALVADRFTAGPLVALEMLDQFSRSSANRPVSETIEQLTGRVLPDVRSETWAVDARLALASHALALWGPSDDPVKRRTVALAESYDRRRELLARLPAAARSAEPEEAARALSEAWLGLAEASRSQAHPEWGSLDDLQRRRALRLQLAEGPLQRFVAEQLLVLELIGFVTAAEQPPLAALAGQLVSESAAERSRMRHVLAQAVAVERAIGRLWQLRLGLSDREGKLLAPMFKGGAT